MRRPTLRYGALAAACLAVALVWLLAPGGQPTAEAFNKFATAIVEAKSAKFASEVAIEGQPKQKFLSYYQAPGHFRQEIGQVFNVMDIQAGKIMSVNPAMKTATVMNMKNRPKDQGAAHFDFFVRMQDLLSKRRNAGDDDYERLSEREIDGQRAVGFRLDSSTGIITLWGNPVTGKPVRVETVFSGVPRTEVAMTDFDFNVELKESLFDITPPDGYKVQSFDVDASPFTEKDLLAALRVAAELGDGAFPDGLDTASVNRLIVNYATKRGKKKLSDDGMDELMQKSMSVGRGFGFAAALPASANAHYAGKGVRRDTPDRAIFWYKPEGKKDYQVIDADLTVHQADRAPDVAGAVKVGKSNPVDKTPQQK